MGSSESTEMYLETILLLERKHGHAHISDIALELGVSKPSVSKAMKLLKSEGLIVKEAYGSVNLTSEGLKYSERVYRNHQLITDFLKESLGLTHDVADRNACRMEHVVEEEMLIAMEKYLEGGN